MNPPGQNHRLAIFGWLRLPLRRSWLLALVLLAAVDWYIARVFVPYRLAPYAAPPHAHLRDRSGGNNLGVVMRMAERPQLWPHPRVVMVGDSTVMGALDPDPKTLVGNVRTRIEGSKLVPAPVSLIEFAAAGLPATDASVLIAKSLGLGVDLVVYAMTPRIICEMPRRVTDASSWVLDPDVRAVLGLGYVLENYEVKDFLRGVLVTHWDLLRFRNEIQTWFQLQRYRLPEPWRPRAIPLPYAPVALYSPVKRTEPIWTYGRCVYDERNPNFRALRRIVEMCGETGRCLLYHGPLNPVALDQFEQGMVAEFDQLVRGWTSDHGVAYRNYKFSVGVGGFNRLKSGRGEVILDALHMNPRGRWQLAGFIAADAARLLATQLAADAHAPLASVASDPRGG